MIHLVKEYASKRLELLKLEATEKSSKGAGLLVFFGLAALAALFFILLFNIGVGLYIGSLLGNYGYGILIVAGFYLLVLLLLIVLRKFITSKVAGGIIKFIND
ncbi:phage holin family protein [Chryseobacterium sp. A301]